MIAPRRTRLIRVPTLRGFQRAIVETVAALGEQDAAAVLAPTGAAVDQLRRTLAAAGVFAPRTALVTRRGWYAWLRGRAEAPRLLTTVEREVLAAAAAREAAADAAYVTASAREAGAAGVTAGGAAEASAAAPDAATNAVSGGASAAAPAAAASAADPVGAAAAPFRLRPGIVAALLAFYDDLLRRRRSIEAFERLMIGELDPIAGIDRGARRLLHQTRFLVAAFHAYARRLEASPGIDEHRLRERLLARGPGRPIAELIVTVPDHAAHAAGLYPADYDLLARLPSLERITLIATDALLDSGYRERLDDLLPGLTEERAAPDDRPPPQLLAPAEPADRPYFIWRDREEELRGIAGAVRRPERAPAAAVVVQRPLPYLYLAASVFGEAGLAVQAADGLPLAVEPYAAAVDLVLTCAASGFARAPLVALLRSPHFRFAVDGDPPPPAAVRALDRQLRTARPAGGRAALAACASPPPDGANGSSAASAPAPAASAPAARAAPALRCALALVDEMAPLADRRPLADHLATLRTFLVRHEAPIPPAEAGGRAGRGRALVRDGLEALETAHRRLDAAGAAVGPADTASAVRRWIESRTFAPDPAARGVQILDRHAAAYGRFDDVFVAGLVDAEWPGPATRNIFYPGGLLAGLGWPRDRDRVRAARAAFHDLLGLAAARTRLSTFSLEDDATVAASTLLEDLDDLPVVRIPPADRPSDAPSAPPGADTPSDAQADWPADPRVDQRAAAPAPAPAPAPSAAPAPAPAPAPAAIPPDAPFPTPADRSAEARVDPGVAAAWRAWRLERAARRREARPAPGRTGPRPPGTYTVSALERYVDCPFIYFSRDVLGLEDEDRGADRTMTQAERGRFLHGLFETFYRGWQADGRGPITPSTLDAALDRFTAAAEAALARQPARDRAVVRAWLLGSAAAPGLAEQLFVAELEGGTDVVERLLEYRIAGRFDLGAARPVALRGVIDRIDLFADRTFRLVDYKTSRPPRPGRGLQLPIYVRCAEQQLAARRGPGWRAVDAHYVAFGDPRLHVPVPGGDLPRAVADGAARVVAVVDAIEAGIFPPRPAERRLCATCGYATVCRMRDAR